MHLTHPTGIGIRISIIRYFIELPVEGVARQIAELVQLRVPLRLAF